MGLAVVAAAVLVVDSDAPGVRVPVGSSSSASDGPRADESDRRRTRERGPPRPRRAVPAGAPRPAGYESSTCSRTSARAKAPAIATPPRRFVWAPRPGASGYNVELFKGRALVFRAATSKPEIVIPRRWRLNGRPRRLEPGLYRWYVWSRIAGRRESTATVQAKFVVPTR